MTGAPPVQRPSRRAPSRWLILALGLLIGRVASQLPDGVLPLVNFAIVALVAVSITLMWRGWARRAMESRRLEQQRRAKP